MKTNKLVYGLFGLMALASCSDKMDYSETVVKDKDYVIQTFEKVGGFMTDIYNYADYDYGQNFGGGMLASATDESVYSVSDTCIIEPLVGIENANHQHSFQYFIRRKRCRKTI
jgi:hypothetical protein